MTDAKFKEGDFVRKKRGSQWHGRIVGVYKTDLTVEGYAVESHFERGSVQIYPVAALEAWVPAAAPGDEVARIVSYLNKEAGNWRDLGNNPVACMALQNAVKGIARGAHREEV